MLKLQTTTVTTAALLGVTGLAWMGSSFAQDAAVPDRKAAPQANGVALPDPFVIDLKGAGTLEVLWIADHREGGRAWSVEGKLLPAKPLEVMPYVESLALTGDEKQDLLEVWVRYKPSYTKVRAHFIYRGEEEPTAAPERDWVQQIHLERQDQSPTGRANFTREEMEAVARTQSRMQQQGIFPLLVERPDVAKAVSIDAHVVAGEPIVVQAWDENGERFPERTAWAKGGPVLTPRGDGDVFVQTEAYFDMRHAEGLGGFHQSVAWIDVDGNRHVLDQSEVPWSLPFDGQLANGTYGRIGAGALVRITGVDPSRVASFELLAAPWADFRIDRLPAQPGGGGRPLATVPEPKPIPPLATTRPAN